CRATGRSARLAWSETVSEHFAARHEEADAEDAAGVLELLEATRARLARAFAVVPAGVDVILHGSDAQLLVARPGIALDRAVAAPAARRYVTGTWSRRELHVLAPRRLEERASAVPGSRELVRGRDEAEAVRLVDEGVLRHAFGGAPLREIEARWRTHLERLTATSP